MNPYKYENKPKDLNPYKYKKKPENLTEDELYFAQLVAKWVDYPKEITIKDQKDLRMLSYVHYHDSVRAKVARKALNRGITTGFKTHKPIVDFLEGKTFGLKRRGKPKILESWARGLPRPWFRDATDTKLPHPIGIMFSHKFKPDEIVFHIGTQSLDPDVAREIDKLINLRSVGVTRSSESEVLIDAYEKNMITICGNVKKFNLTGPTLNKESVFDALMNRLDAQSQEKFEEIVEQGKNKKEYVKFMQFACVRNSLKLDFHY